MEKHKNINIMKMQKNSIWAKQLTPEQLEQFKDNIRSYSCSGDTFEEYMLKSSRTFHSFMNYAFRWDRTDTLENGFTQGHSYWGHVANGTIEEFKPTPSKIDEGFKSLSNMGYSCMLTPEQKAEKMRDEIALEAMKAILSSPNALTSNDTKEIGKCSYKIADAMLEARKIKTEA